MGDPALLNRYDVIELNPKTCGLAGAKIRHRSHAFSAEQFCARSEPNNATRLSAKEWLWSAKRA
jgi:hypothetical protein